MSLQATDEAPSGFNVSLANFEGPFDLLLQLIGKHELDITEVALSRVTNEFIAYIKELDGDLEQTTQFLLVASTLLDLKTARLLPQGEVEDEEDLALLEARDLLFARLLQYRAFKQVAAMLAQRLAVEDRRYSRTVGLEPRFASLLPEVIVSIGPSELAMLAAGALAPKPEPLVSLAHLHAPQVSVREQAHLVVERLKRDQHVTFRALCADADVMTTVARFLALLELFREGVVSFDQASPLGELHLRWTGSDDAQIEVSDEFDGESELPSAVDAGPEVEPIALVTSIAEDPIAQAPPPSDPPPSDPPPSDTSLPEDRRP